MDGQGCEEWRVGIQAFLEFGGKTYRKKDGTKTPMSFSSTLIVIAGGLRKFIEEWEEDPNW